MEEIKHDPNCPHCAEKTRQEAESEELNFAVLIALMPILTITFLSNAGIF